ncbi:MAG: hypothetical protein IJZ23_05605 [Roseburia sp.]|nr:hypothetical protein [Roseburia sp.]
MKKKLVLVIATLMCVSLCACGGTETTNSNNNTESTSVDSNSETKTEQNGFTPNQPTETEEIETKENASDMTVEEMQKYYDVEKYVGTPRLVTCRYMGGGLNPVAEEEGLTVYQIEDDDRLENFKKYDCIICDNDTPDYQADDVVVYIFIK